MASDDLEPGSVIDGFRIEQRVHQGGMATLWRVTRGDQTVPLLMKIPKIFEGAEPAAIVSFEMEQMILPRLSGIHVPRYVVAGAFDKQPHVVMEQIPGVALIRRLGELPLPYAEVADIGRRIATALQDLHRQHVIHHDIKPSNIIFRPSGEAVLLDYGFWPFTTSCLICCMKNSVCHSAPRLIWRQSGCAIFATSRAVTSFRSACCCIFLPPACGRSARARPWPVCAVGCGAIPIRRDTSGQIVRHGSRRSYCAVSRSSRHGVTSAILEFARENHVSHILIGARQNSLKRSLLGSVSAEVAAGAACSVTVVRPPERGDVAV